MPFVNETRLIVSPGQVGATGNLYVGLHDYAEMTLVLHLLRDGDFFMDIGANVGSYTVLAAGVAGAHCISVEPVPATFDVLLDNVNLNRLQDRVRSLNIGLGEASGQLTFSTNQDAMNHVLLDRSATADNQIEVPVSTVDEEVGEVVPVMMKIDVEGFELPVLHGAHKTLSKQELLVVVLETNGSGESYGYGDAMVHRSMREYGFSAVNYDPTKREITMMPQETWNHGNTIYMRDLETIKERIAAAREFRLGTGAIV